MPGTLQSAAKLLSFCFNCLHEGRKLVKAIRFYSPFTENAPSGRLRDASLMSISWNFSREGHRFASLLPLQMWLPCALSCKMSPFGSISLYQWQCFDNLVGVHCPVHGMVFALRSQPSLAESNMQN